ncbi:MAG TPA: BadF/BadG/BcrA/BcrD ATPase family protein [Bacteroidota bacterium]|nr:BadF/BadG/BcrA/BcrD ATPase family protein [Bacteroidota bacterium]
MAQKNRYVVGLDGGGTKTAAIIADVNGTEAAEVVGGPSNFQMIGVEKAAEVLFGLIETCAAKVHCGFDNIASVVAGLTGAGRQSDQDRMREGFRSFARQRGPALDSVLIESDARIALEGAFLGKPGIILIAGTGSIAFGKDAQAVIHRVGGWGRMLGDEGSGYTIGREGLNAVTKDLDGRGEHTQLTKLVGDRFGLTDQEKMIAAVYRENFDIASVAPLVLEAASKHDPECERILNRAAAELCEHVRVMTHRMNSARKDRSQKIRLAFIGTVAGGENVLSRILKRKISSTLAQIKIVSPEASPARGAVLMALSLATQR